MVNSAVVWSQLFHAHILLISTFPSSHSGPFRDLQDKESLSWPFSSLWYRYFTGQLNGLTLLLISKGLFYWFWTHVQALFGSGRKKVQQPQKQFHVNIHVHKSHQVSVFSQMANLLFVSDNNFMNFSGPSQDHHSGHVHFILQQNHHRIWKWGVLSPGSCHQIGFQIIYNLEY